MFVFENILTNFISRKPYPKAQSVAHFLFSKNFVEKFSTFVDKSVEFSDFLKPSKMAKIARKNRKTKIFEVFIFSKKHSKIFFRGVMPFLNGANHQPPSHLSLKKISADSDGPLLR